MVSAPIEINFNNYIPININNKKTVYISTTVSGEYRTWFNSNPNPYITDWVINNPDILQNPFQN